MDVILASTVTAISEALSVPLNEAMTEILAESGKTHVTMIVELANRFRRHRGGPSLKISDMKDAISAKGLQPLFGYHRIFRPPDYTHAGQAGGGDVYVLDDYPNAYQQQHIRHPSMLQYPTEPTFTFHWLAVNGVVPNIAENQCETVTDSLDLVGIPPDAEVSDQDLTIVTSNARLPQELREFLNSFLKVATGSSYEQLEEKLRILQHLPAMQPLVPYFLRIITDAVRTINPSDMELALLVAQALFRNETLDLGAFVQNFVSIALTLAVFEETPGDATMAGDDTYKLRERGASFLSMIKVKYQDSYPELWNQTAESLLVVILTPNISPSQYGALLAIQSLGEPMVRRSLIPVISPFLERLKEESESPDANRRTTAAKILGACRRVCGNSFWVDLSRRRGARLDKDTAEMYDSIAEHLGYSSFALFAPR